MGDGMKDISKLWNRYYILLMIAQLATSFSFYMVVTILVSYLVSDRVGISAAAAGVVAGLFSVTALVCRPFCGVMSDRLHKPALLKASVIMMGIGTVGYGISHTLPFLIFFRILNGAGFAISSTTLIAMVAQYIPEKRMGEGIGYFGLANVLASAAGPGLGAILAEKIGVSFVFQISACTCLAELILLSVFSFDREKKEERPSKKLMFSDIIAVPVLGYTVTGSIFSLINGILSAYLVMFGEALNISAISLYFTWNALALFLVRPAAGRLADRKNAAAAVLPGIILTAASMLLLCGACYGEKSAFWIIMASAVLRGIGQGAAHPALQTSCIQKVGKERSGSAVSTFYLGGDIGQGTGPMLAGVIIGKDISTPEGYRQVFLMCVGMLAAGFLLFLFQWKKEKSMKAS